MNLTSRPRRPILRKILRWLLFSAVILVTLIALAYSALSYWGRREWAKTQAELRARGEKLSLVELMPPPVPDEDNFFATPIWREVLELEPASAQDGTAILKQKKKIQDTRIEIFGKALRISEGNSVWSVLHGGYEKGTKRDLNAAAGLYRDEKKAPPGLSSAQTILAALDIAKEEFEELRIAAQRPQASLGLPREGGMFHLQVPHLSPSLYVSQYLMVRIAAEAADGQGAEAQSNLYLLFRLADALQSDPLFISMLVRLSVLKIAIQSIWDGLEAGCWSDKQLVEIQNRLSQIDISHDFANGLRAERGGANQTFEAYALKGGMAQMIKDTTMMVEMTSGKKLSEWDKQLAKLDADLYPRGLLFESLAIYDRLLQGMIEDSEANPFAPEVGEAIQRQISELQKFPNPSLYPLIALSLPVIASPQTLVSNVEARLRQAQMAIALDRYHLAKGSFPESLEELVPAYLTTLPPDVIDGKNFRYRREAPDQFVLWSIGANRLDDAGTPPTRSNKLEEGDWIWRTANEAK